MADDLDGVIEETGMARRTFMRRLVTGSVFAVPVVASFAMSGIEAASASAKGQYPGGPMGGANQTIAIGNGNQPQQFGWDDPFPPNWSFLRSLIP